MHSKKARMSLDGWTFLSNMLPRDFSRATELGIVGKLDENITIKKVSS
jgi:hypothetical protein